MTRVKPASDDRIVILLEQILGVVALQVAPEKNGTERALMLKRVGVDNVTIAKVLGTSPNTVRALMANFRKGR